MFEGTELLVHPVSAKRWRVVQRPITDRASPIDAKDIKLLVTVTSRKEAVLFAEGRQSATGQPIRMH
jgi:hypothetical protein